MSGSTVPLTNTYVTCQDDLEGRSFSLVTSRDFVKSVSASNKKSDRY